ACGDDDSSDATNGGGGDMSGQLVLSGSSTVEPISIAVATAFSESNPDVAISVTGPGTGDGFAQFCAGETDISDASRPIHDDEAQTCADNGIEFIELTVAVDGLSVVTSAHDDAIECLSFVDLYALLGPDATGTTNWSDATERADEYAGTVTDLGAVNTPYPDAELTVTGPGEESGTFDSFVDFYVNEGITTLVGSGEGQVPYVPLTDEELAETQSVWAARQTGTRAG
ncbi:MAG TPA: substrate-binding domain-containing protein, partial [Ilumatobacteraceae bacterium]